MRPALPDDGFLYRCTAAVAGLTSALVNLKMVLESSSAINPINAGTVLADAPQEHLLDGLQERCGFLFGE